MKTNNPYKGGIVKKLFVMGIVALAMAACSSNEKSDMDDKGSMAADSAKSATADSDKKDEGKKDGGDMQASKASCTLDKDTRVIEVKKTESGGCELFYTKFGEAKSVASSGFGTQYCEEVKDRIQSNLNKAGFTCQ